MITKLTSFILLIFAIFSWLKSDAQCSTTYPSQGTCSGCTNNPSGSITFSSNGQKACYSGTGTISTLTFNGSNDTVYICGNITVTNWAGYGSSPVLVVNSGGTFTITNAPSSYFYQNIKFVNYGTFNASSSWTNFYSSYLINATPTAIMNFTGSLTTTGGIIYLNGGFFNVSGTLNFNSSNTSCFSNNAIINAATLQNTGSPGASIPSGSAACMSLTSSYSGSNDPLVSNSSPGTLNVCAQGSSSNYPAATSASWGGAVVTLNCNTQCNLILPISFGDLSLTHIGTKIILNWSFYDEESTGDFEIQRSSDGNNFISIGSLPKSYSSSQQNYSYIDYSPATGVNYYRLKFTKTDGSASYSEIAKIDTDLPAEMKVISNAQQKNIQVILPRSASNSTLRLIDMQGRLLKTVSVAGNTSLITIESPGLTSGIYIIEFISSQAHQSKQFYFTGQ